MSGTNECPKACRARQAARSSSIPAGGTGVMAAMRDAIRRQLPAQLPSRARKRTEEDSANRRRWQNQSCRTGTGIGRSHRLGNRCLPAFLNLSPTRRVSRLRHNQRMNRRPHPVKTLFAITAAAAVGFGFQAMRAPVAPSDIIVAGFQKTTVASVPPIASDGRSTLRSSPRSRSCGEGPAIAGTGY